MKIALLCQAIDEIGGIQRVVVQLANALNINHNVTIVTFGCNEKKSAYQVASGIDLIYKPYSKDTSIFSKGARYLVRNTGLYSIDRLSTRAYYNTRLLQSIIEVIKNGQYECIIGSAGLEGSVSFAVLLGMIKEKLPNVKMIGWQHNSFEMYFSRYFKNQHKLAKKYLPNLNGLVTLTHSDAKKYLTEFKVTATGIHNPIGFVCDEKSTTDNKQIIFVGRLVTEQKGLDYLIQILHQVIIERQHTDWSAVIVGEGPDRSSLEARIQEVGLSSYIKLIGETLEVKEQYTASSILISTSRWEGFGLVITEAMECGLPVVAFKNDGPNEIIVDGKSGYLIENYDLKQFADRLDNLMYDSTLRKQMAVKASERSKVFSIACILSKWEDLLES